MCLSLDNDLIQIQEKTQEFKYEFLSSYIPMWNSIICGKGRRKRAIIETHAGTGKVLLDRKKLLGSSLLFLQKTALKQEALSFFFIEREKKHYKSLKKNIDEIIKEGFFFSGDSKKKIEVIEKNGLIFQKESPKYKPIRKFPKIEQINLFNADCLNVIDDIMLKIENRPAFFFIDPCGKFNWALIKKIVTKRLLDENRNIIKDKEGNKIQGTELFINFSWEAILRFNPEKRDDRSRNKFFKEIYGMDYNEIFKELMRVKKKFKRSKKRYSKFDLYLEIYKNNLRKYFDFVSELSIPGIKSEKNPVYAMIFCTNNKSAEKLFENKAIQLSKLKKQFLMMKNLSPKSKEYKYQDFRDFLKQHKKLDEF